MNVTIAGGQPHPDHQPASLYEAISAAGRHRGDHPAIVEAGGTTVTYAELEHLVDRITAGLARHGIGPGASLACVLRNSARYVALIVATARLGANYVPLLTNFDAADVRTALGRALPSLVVADGHRTVDAAGRSVVALDDLATTGGPAAALPAQHGVFRRLWTSGSTTFPKMMAWQQDKFVTERRRWTAHAGIVADDVFFCRHTIDVAHATDLHVFAALLTGATVVLADPAAPPARLLDQLVRHRATVMSALPAHYDELAAACPTGGVDLSSLRRPLCGGAYLSPAVIRRSAETLGIGIRQIYGATEFGLALGDMARPPHLDGRMYRVAGVETRLEPLPGGGADVGELVLISDCTSEGYVEDDAANARTFRGREFWTGDVAACGADGTFRILGRVSDVLAARGGLLTAPVVDEELAAAGPVAAAVCLPEFPGEYRDRAFVAVRPAPGATEAEAVAAVADVLTAHGLTAAVRCVDRIPRTPVGKVDKPVLRARFEAAGVAR
jgi:acyl-coenzyme A synthetase/AMP-(fatty) acid ligase